jgi:uncharacterized protein YhbP (UPF0306 family)
MSEDPAAIGRRIVDSSMYLTLATADADGRPWVSPVWFTAASHTRFLWASRDDARHSRNITVRPEVAITMFDSTVPVGEAEAVYFEAVAEQVREAQLEEAIAVYSRRSTEVGASAWTVADVTTPSPLRLYRATAGAAFVLGTADRRVPVDLDGSA